MSRPTPHPSRPPYITLDALLSDRVLDDALDRLDARYAEYHDSYSSGLIVADVRNALAAAVTAELARSCAKIPYDTRRKAERAGRSIPGYTRAYEHARCGKWHLTSQPLAAHQGPSR